MIYLIPNSKNNDEEVSQLSENLKMMMDPNRKGNVKKLGFDYLVFLRFNLLCTENLLSPFLLTVLSIQWSVI